MPGSFTTGYLLNTNPGGTAVYQDLGSTAFNLVEKSEIIDYYSGILPTLKKSGLFTAGYNFYGALGDNTNVNYRSSPVQTVSQGLNWVTITGGSYGAITGIKSDGTLWTWGRNNTGNLGLNDTINRSSPVQIGTNKWLTVNGGYNGGTVLAIKEDGTLWGWGYNVFVMLGNNSADNFSSPIQIGTDNGWRVAVSDSDTISAGIRNNDALYFWGLNSYIIGGAGTTNSPSQIGTDVVWKTLDVGSRYIAAIKNDNTLWLWGEGANGKLGHNDVINRSSPVQLGAGTDWKQVSCNLESTAAIKTNGTLWVWGEFATGPGTAFSRSSPTQVGSLTNWRRVSVGSGYFNGKQHLAAINSTGNLFVWGGNAAGQSFLNNRTDTSSPVQVTYNAGRWKHVHCGREILMAIAESEEF